MHFTTNSGLVGMLATGSVKSRNRLNQNQYVEHIFRPNVEFRKDENFLDYVNLSIESINGQFFNVSSRKWHAGEQLWWCVLAFDASVLLHPGVLFATTNNMYTGVSRQGGVQGFQALYDAQVTKWFGCAVRRGGDMPASHTTCPQAEVLYPGELDLDALREIYVSTPEDSDTVAGYLEVFNQLNVEVIIDPNFSSLTR